MKTLQFFFILLIAAHSVFGQQKYAVIINASSPGVPGSYDEFDSTNSWRQSNGDVEPYYEFWNDVYLMWEMLYERGFEDENIFVIYHEGSDFEFPFYNERYTAGQHNLEKITDYRAWESAVDSVFTGLAQGINGFPKIEDDDFFVLYTFGHGSTYGIGLLPIPPVTRAGLSWEELSTYISAFNCHKKLIMMQQCYSGSSIEHLEDANTVILTAANDSMTSWGIDNLYFDDIDYPGDPNPGNAYSAYEREQYPGDTMSYRHGEFNLHLFNAIRKADPGNQSVYYQTDYENFLLNNADANNDNYTSISESFNWIREYDSKMRFMPEFSLDNWDDPQLSDISNISQETSIMYPTLLHTDIANNQTHRGLIGVSKNIHVTAGNQLTFHANSKVVLLNMSEIVVDQGATLIIENGVHIYGDFLANLSIYGDIQIGTSVVFERFGNEGYFYGLALMNDNAQVNINSVTFRQAKIHNLSAGLTMTNSYFDDCDIVYSHLGNVTFSTCSFFDTWLYIENNWEEYDFTAAVNNCTFYNSTGTIAGIDIWNYDKFFITNNTINGYFNGIQIMMSGEGASGNQSIFENEILNCTNAAISTYNSTLSIAGNNIHNNNYGVRLSNNCNTALFGNPSAETYAESQQIMDNDSYEVYASTGSFPWYLRHNVIIDEDNLGNPSDPMVYYEPDPNGGLIIKDVRYNCWGTNFNSTEDLYPTGYNVDPTWCPGGVDIEQEAAETLYLTGKEQFDNEDYATAKSTFEMVINQYPETEYAGASMKDLLAVEKFVTYDYNALQQYYNTDPTIQADPVLSDLSIFLSNKCDIRLENWQLSIDHYEYIIDNPESTEDSIFAIIDLGHVYFLMANSGGRSSARGKMPEHIPQTMEQFYEKRTLLLALLPLKKDNSNDDLNTDSSNLGTLLQNSPNPFSGITSIAYELYTTGIIELKVVDLNGNIMQEKTYTRQPGVYTIDIDMGELPSGIYYYSLFVNGTFADTKKMIVSR